MCVFFSLGFRRMSTIWSTGFHGFACSLLHSFVLGGVVFLCIVCQSFACSNSTMALNICFWSFGSIAASTVRP